MKDRTRPEYPKFPSSAGRSAVVGFSMEDERGMEAIDPEQARRFLAEESPKRIERLRRELRRLKFYVRERGLASGRHSREEVHA